MNHLKIFISLLIIPTTLFITSCTPSDDDVDGGNNAPTNFSSNTSETATSGATIIWTESTDFDGDIVTYTVFLEGKQVASNLNSLTHKFSDLESETIYNGVIEARDGNGGVNKADFFYYRTRTSC